MSVIALSKKTAILDYIEVLKPRESGLHILMGVIAALVAARGNLPLSPFILSVIAISFGIPGANGLTNYLDRDIDTKMRRTCLRALPSRRIYPPEKSLPLVITLLVIGLSLTWFINPLCFISGLVGIVVAALWRKTSAEVFLGVIAGCAPVLIGWFAIRPVLDMQILAICAMVAVWTPLHVWSVMVAYRDDFLNAGLHYFPIAWSITRSVKLLFALSVLLYVISMGIYVVVDFHWLYLIVANVLGILMITACGRLLISRGALSAWRVYKLTAFPYLGVIFITMLFDSWLL
ncbi:MAG: protoheme IX farnesyltransferase [Dehalococcoidia bacterium]|nr:protoheme IX farnesyltransferase [Dehalococcoidia bacterium]